MKAKLNWLNPLNGVVRGYDMTSYQFISLDGARSAFDRSACSRSWTDHIVPQGKQIRTVETMLRKRNGLLYGFKWIGDDGAVLVAVGEIDDDDARNDPDYPVTTLTLNHNQRLVGVRSSSDRW